MLSDKEETPFVQNLVRFYNQELFPERFEETETDEETARANEQADEWEMFMETMDFDVESDAPESIVGVSP